MEAARISVKDVLGAKEGERALIITNPSYHVSRISFALHDAFREMGVEPVILVQSRRTQTDFADNAVIEALKSEPEIILSISEEKLGKDRRALSEPYTVEGKKIDHTYTYLLEAKKSRGFWSPSITVEMFKKTVPIDYETLRGKARRIKELLDNAEEAHITSPKGTDIVIGLREREAFLDDGDFREPGAGGNIPCGETFISPELGSSNGIIVFDGSLATVDGVIVLKEPVRCRVEGGFVKGIDGGHEANVLESSLRKGAEMAEGLYREGKIDKETMEEYVRNARNLGELGIGLNPKAEIVGNMLEDEKAFHTCHIAIGSNYDNDANAMIHLDGLIKNPTIVLKMMDGEERTLMVEGELML
ncbi:MAG: aminopeptidase [Thermoplasmata archaeon]|nr:aminopeptidase [Thermoplasmata archaeon]